MNSDSHDPNRNKRLYQVGYLAQLLLQSIPGVKSEMNAAVQHPGAYDAMLRHNIPLFRRFRKE